MVNITEEWDEYKYEQARAWLEYVRGLGERAKVAQALVESERELLDGLRGIDYSSDGPTSPNDDALVDAISRLQDHIKQYIENLVEYVDVRADAVKRINGLKYAHEIECLYYRYMRNKSWEEICVDMAYTHDGMMKLRRRAIVSAYEVMPNDWRDPLHPAI